MVEIKCLAQDDPNQIYDFCPSFPAAVLFTVLFTGTTLYHTFQAFYYRKTFSWVVIMAGLWELGGYASRTISITRQGEAGVYSAQQLLILLAPLWVNAFIYMTLGRMLHFCLENDRFGGVRARRITLVFVLFDITAFLVQAGGGLMTSGEDPPVSLVKTGLKIYTAGVGLQIVFMVFFSVITLKFQRLLKKQDAGQVRGYAMESISTNTSYQSGTGEGDCEINFGQRGFLCIRPLLIVVWVSLALIFMRNIFRLIEWGIGGVNGNVITKNEWYLYVFDAVPMFLALVAFNVYHPGRILQGPRCDFKAEDRTRKAQKKAHKLDKKTAKKQSKKGFTASSDSAEDLV